MCPTVWSSRRKVKVPVFVIFESGVYDTFDKPSGTTTRFNLSGMFVMFYGFLMVYFRSSELLRLRAEG